MRLHFLMMLLSLMMIFHFMKLEKKFMMKLHQKNSMCCLQPSDSLPSPRPI